MDSSLNVFVYNPVLQSNSKDYGVYPIANVVEFATNGLKDWLKDSKKGWIYDEPEMRFYLVKCLESSKFVPFPKIKLKETVIVELAHHVIEINFCCNYPNYFYKEILECNLSGLWMHDKCAGVNANSYKSKNKPWHCTNCAK